MKTLGPREAADEIRQTILTDQSGRIPPEAAHQLAYTKQVASYLGLDPTPENVNHIALVLREHEIELPTGQEYPKWVTSPVRGAVLVQNADEEGEALSETPPGPVVKDEPKDVAAKPEPKGNAAGGKGTGAAGPVDNSTSGTDKTPSKLEEPKDDAKVEPKPAKRPE